MELDIPISFGDFPDDVQLCILSFLRPIELAAFASTCKGFAPLYRRDERLWFFMCHRRWGSKTLIRKWGDGKISYTRLYRILEEYENLIGFWRRSGDTHSSSPPLVFFEWGPLCITGSRISPSKNRGFSVAKKPFLWMSISADGEPVNYVDPDGRSALIEEGLIGELGFTETELIRVNVSFIGKGHFVVEENFGYSGFTRASSSENVRSEEQESPYGSPPDRLMTEIYQYFANQTSPSGNGASRRQRKREKEKQGRLRKLEPEHFVKIVNCSPTPARPLQGLWKGICDDEMSLDFYLVSYDDVGGIACRKVGDPNVPLAYHTPLFWTSSLNFVESPFSFEEDYIYNSRSHLRLPAETDTDEDHMSVSGILYINSCYDLVIPDLIATVNPRLMEGRVWLYEDGTFGFGFLRDNCIVDLKHVTKNGQIVDAIEMGDR